MADERVAVQRHIYHHVVASYHQLVGSIHEGQCSFELRHKKQNIIKKKKSQYLKANKKLRV
jgi:hypothetical protein